MLLPPALTVSHSFYSFYSFSDSLLSEHTIRAAYLDKDNYKIIVAFPIQVINKTLENLTDIYILVAPVFFLLSLIGGSVISLRALSRIDKIIEALSRYAYLNSIEI